MAAANKLAFCHVYAALNKRNGYVLHVAVAIPSLSSSDDVGTSLRAADAGSPCKSQKLRP
eukprot:4017413-Pleurochrysis_carterae.AAC.1